MKVKKEKYLISISKEFSEELMVKLGKVDGVSWEYLLKRLLERVKKYQEYLWAEGLCWEDEGYVSPSELNRVEGLE